MSEITIPYGDMDETMKAELEKTAKPVLDEDGNLVSIELKEFNTHG
jgi:hypothetical protein